MATKREFLKKAVGKVADTANRVANVAGGEKLVDYTSSKIAKKMAGQNAKYVDDRTSGKEALKSAGNVGLTVAGLASGPGVVRGATSMAAKAGANVAKNTIAKQAVRESAKKLPVKFDKLSHAAGKAETREVRTGAKAREALKKWKPSQDNPHPPAYPKETTIKLRTKRDVLKEKLNSNPKKTSDVSVRERHGEIKGGEYSPDDNVVMPLFSKSTGKRVANSIARHKNKLIEKRNLLKRKLSNKPQPAKNLPKEVKGQAKTKARHHPDNRFCVTVSGRYPGEEGPPLNTIEKSIYRKTVSKPGKLDDRRFKRYLRKERNKEDRKKGIIRLND